MKYEKPIAIKLDDIAEGIYMNSGSIEDPDCWTLAIEKSQIIEHEGKVNFRIDAHHSEKALHISSKTTITIIFNRNIKNANFEGFISEVSGSTVKLTRISHGNSYQSADHFNTLLEVWCDDPSLLEVVTSSIMCTKEVNVQGQID